MPPLFSVVFISSLFLWGSLSYYTYVFRLPLHRFGFPNLINVVSLYTPFRKLRQN